MALTACAHAAQHVVSSKSTTGSLGLPVLIASLHASVSLAWQHHALPGLLLRRPCILLSPSACPPDV